MIRLATSSQLSGWNRNLPLTTEAEMKNEVAYKKINKNTWKAGGLRPKPLLKDFPPQLFFSEFWKLFKNSIFHGTPPMVSKPFHWFLYNNNIEIEWAKSWGVFRTQTNVYNEAFFLHSQCVNYLQKNLYQGCLIGVSVRNWERCI